MSRFKSDFLRTLDERGFIHQISDEAGLDELFAKETVTAYIGFDPTAPSLHAGGLIQIMMLHWMQKTGHRPISLMGGGTGMVGDPSFKDDARQLMTVETIESNIASIKRVFSSYLSYGDLAGSGRALPTRGFGQIWANNRDVRESLGFPLTGEVGANLQSVAVPEPAVALLAMTGLLALGSRSRRRAT